MSIVVVDDSSAARLLLCGMLKKIAPSKKITPCPNGALALAEITSGKPVDLLVLDLGLPDISGYHILEVISHLGLNIPIITLSDESNQSALKRSIELGADHYITKPLSYQHLSKAFESVLETEEATGAILVVDDVELDRNLCASLIEKIGFPTLTASNGYEALRIVENNHVSMILMDMMMPYMDGLKASQKVKLIYPDIPIAMITSDVSKVTQDTSVAESFDLLIEKPTNKRVLRKAIKELIRVKEPTLVEDNSSTEHATTSTKVHFPHDKFYKFAPAPLLQESLEQGNNLERGLKSIQESSVIFINISQLSEITKDMNSDECFSFMNSFFGLIHPVIQSFGGSLQRFFHDGLLAFFPLHKKQYTNNAIHAAISIQDTVTIYNRGRRRAGYSPIDVGIGISTGPVAVGICGSELRYQDGAFGTTLHEATEALNTCGPLKTDIIITSSTFQMVHGPEDFFMNAVRSGEGVELPLYTVSVYPPSKSKPIKADPLSLMGKEKMRTMIRDKSALVSAISHDIKNTLTSTQGIFNCIKDSVEGTDVEGLVDVGLSKLHLTNDYLQNLLSFLKDNVQDKEETEENDLPMVDLKSLLHKVVHSHSFDADREDVRLQVLPSEDHLYYHISQMDFNMCLSNLIGNAIKFTEAGGNVQISLKKMPHGKTQHRILLTVEDTGRGIPKEYLSKIDQPYFQISEEDKSSGMGLGLCNVRNVAKKYGGKFSVQSTEGKGSRFEVEMTLKKAESNADESSLEPQRILLVDDDPISLRVTQLALKNQGHNVTACRNIPKALLAHRTMEFDIVLSDFLFRPEGNAFDLIEALKPHQPVVCYSGEEKLPVGYKEKGIHSLVPKPASIEFLQGALHQALRETQSRV